MQIKIFEIEKEDDGLRLDRWFHRHIPNMPFTIVAKLARKGQIRLDGKRVKINTRIGHNQKIRTPIIEYDAPIKQEYIKPNNFDDIKNKIFSSIIHEDKHIIVLNKPYDLCVQDGSNVKISIDRVFKLSNLDYNIVHRIDKETTGLIVFAKNPSIAAEISKLFREKEIYKSYLTILCGIPKNNEGVIESIIKTGDFDAPKELHAKTKFRVLGEYENLLSLVEMTPLTGRKHQIRIHSKEINCPILGDKKHNYPGVKHKIYFADHLHLHSHSLNFTLLGENYYFKAELPDHFQQTIDKYFSTVNISSL
jgi:23S rRNA pseudouridine955/2504/2580 synthase